MPTTIAVSTKKKKCDTRKNKGIDSAVRVVISELFVIRRDGTTEPVDGGIPEMVERVRAGGEAYIGGGIPVSLGQNTAPIVEAIIALVEEEMKKGGKK